MKNKNNGPKLQPFHSGHKVGRNDPCYCGAKYDDIQKVDGTIETGKSIKYKHCHLRGDVSSIPVTRSADMTHPSFTLKTRVKDGKEYSSPGIYLTCREFEKQQRGKRMLKVTFSVDNKEMSMEICGNLSEISQIKKEVKRIYPSAKNIEARPASNR